MVQYNDVIRRIFNRSKTYAMKKPMFRLKKNLDGTYNLQEKGVFFGWNTHTYGYVNLTYEDAKHSLEEQHAFYDYKPEYLYPPLPEEEPK